MINDYKRTRDPTIDTFKVQYLLGGSAVLAVLFPYKYEFTEVREPNLGKHPTYSAKNLRLHNVLDLVGIFDMA